MQQVKNTYTYAEMKHESSYIDKYIHMYIYMYIYIYIYIYMQYLWNAVRQEETLAL